MNTIILSIRLLSENMQKLQDRLVNSSVGNILEIDPQTNSVLDESVEVITELEENASVAVATLSDLINYDKIESKTFSIEKYEVNVWSVVEKTVHPLSFQAKEKGILMTLNTQISSLQPGEENLKTLRLMGDAIKLGQVIRNLVSNALKFTPPGGQVTISGI